MRRNNILFTASFAMSVAITGIQFGLIFLLSDRFGFSAGNIGLSIAIGYGSYMTGCELFRRISGSVNPRFSIPSAVSVMTFSAFAIWISRNSFLTGAAWFLFQGATAFFWPPLMGWIASGIEGKELNRDLGRFNQSWSFGFFMGPLISGFLYSRDPGGAFLFFTILLILLTCFLTLSSVLHRDMKEMPARKRDGEAGESSQSGKSEGSFLRFPSWIGLFCAYAFLGVVINILPLEIRDSLGYSEQTAGSFLFIRGITSLAAFTILGKTVKWHFNKKWILLTQGTVIAVPFLLMSSASPLPCYLTALVVFGFLFSAAYSNSIFHGCAGTENRGGRMAVHEGVLTAGAAAGSFIGGLIYQKWGITGSVLFLSALSLSGFMISLLLILIKRERNSS